MFQATLPADHAERETLRKRLKLIQIVSIADALLLVVLLALSYLHLRTGVRIVGSLHGAGFLLLVGLAMEGAAEGWWGWWFPGVIVVSLGPVGSIWGEMHIRKQLAAAA